MSSQLNLIIHLYMTSQKVIVYTQYKILLIIEVSELYKGMFETKENTSSYYTYIIFNYFIYVILHRMGFSLNNFKA